MTSYSLEELKKECEKFVGPKFTFKLCNDDKTLEKYLVVMVKDEKTKTNEGRNVLDSKFANYRANALRVIKMFNLNDKTKKETKINHQSEFYAKAPKTIYELNKIVSADSFNDDIDVVCSNGIHYYTTLEAAFFNRKTPANYTGEWMTHYDNGIQHTQSSYNNGVRNKDWKLWRDDGTEFV